MQVVMALVSGLLFGLGLILSGMTDPSKVIGFLDLAGNWNPSLAFVMAGAIMVGFVAFRLAASRRKAFLGDIMRLPAATAIDRRLVLGGLTFGVGWGLAGYCPGPALVSLSIGRLEPFLFVLAMLGGMLIFEVLERFLASSQQRTGTLR